MKVYLCGPINACTDSECKDWREWAKAHLPDTLDPMRRDYRGKEDEEYATIVENDKADIDACDALLVNYVKPSVGTAMEVLYAWEMAKRIVVVAAPGTTISPWLRYHSRVICHSFPEALEHLK